ncbi:MAG: bifunctional oligoribonuclease/PAP phosphatase NrnA, partial [Planctomycetes bacterium]|nr:bifunctional oligoribonuclease/PAP phosphatase NrnA [Planctomycetota bacterium]
VNEALTLAGVEAAVLLVENTDCVRVSLRSRDLLDVADVARAFGGGGHARAAGLRLDEDIDALKTKLVAACAERLS